MRHTEETWVYDTGPYGDWGEIRNKKTGRLVATIATANFALDELREHRENGTDPVAEISQHFVLAVNAHDQLVEALREIAVGEGHYGAQAFEYKQIARKALALVDGQEAG